MGNKVKGLELQEDCRILDGTSCFKQSQYNLDTLQTALGCIACVLGEPQQLPMPESLRGYLKGTGDGDQKDGYVEDDLDKRLSVLRSSGLQPGVEMITLPYL